MLLSCLRLLKDIFKAKGIILPEENNETNVCSFHFNRFKLNKGKKALKCRYLGVNISTTKENIKSLLNLLGKKGNHFKALHLARFILQP